MNVTFTMKRGCEAYFRSRFWPTVWIGLGIFVLVQVTTCGLPLLGMYSTVDLFDMGDEGVLLWLLAFVVLLSPIAYPIVVTNIFRERCKRFRFELREDTIEVLWKNATPSVYAFEQFVHARDVKRLQGCLVVAVAFRKKMNAHFVNVYEFAIPDQEIEQWRQAVSCIQHSGGKGGEDDA